MNNGHVNLKQVMKNKLTQALIVHREMGGLLILINDMKEAGAIIIIIITIIILIRQSQSQKIKNKICNTW